MKTNQGFLAFAWQWVATLRQAGRVRTAETYTCALNSFIRFHAQELPFEAIDAALLMAYEHHLRALGLCPNTTSFYLRNLRAIYNRAVEQQLMPQRNPFKYVYTGIDKTVKRAVPIAVILRLKQLDLVAEPSLDLVRDLFLFSFYTRGMSFVDMAFLRRSDLRQGILTYRRRKTNQQLLIRWDPLMQAIVDKHAREGSPYLLPIIQHPEKDTWKQYQTMSHYVNRKLKQLGERMGMTIPLTTYVARHSWATIAKEKNIPLSIISEAMGHDSERTTRIYLATLDLSGVDNANQLILNLFR